MVSPATYTNFDFPVSPAYQLKANTRYWIGFISVNQTVIHLAWTDDLSGRVWGRNTSFFKDQFVQTPTTRRHTNSNYRYNHHRGCAHIANGDVRQRPNWRGGDNIGCAAGSLCHGRE